jgi:cyclopropane-fatty-acyl-phospholipid synthase
MDTVNVSLAKDNLFKRSVSFWSDRILDAALRKIICTGALTVITSSGQRQDHGDGIGTPVTIRFHSPVWQLAVVLDPELRVGEAYADGHLTVEKNSIADFLYVVVSNYNRASHPLSQRWLHYFRSLLRTLFRHNNQSRSRSNAAFHYNINYSVYRLFLDADLQYSCAYFRDKNVSLDDAQIAKIQLIAAKLNLDKDKKMTVLDIGSGWGGLALYLARRYSAKVTGINLSKEQIGIARARAAEEKEPVACQFLEQHYQNVTGMFDRIVSVGMFEHVGKQYYPAFFRKCFDLLAHDGVMLLHTIGRPGGPSDTNAWINKYIFPGGYTPALSEIMPSIERAGFIASDIEILRLHYAETLKHWRTRFDSNRDKVLNIIDDRFIRMWDFYLAGFEASFRDGAFVVFQIQLIKNVTALPVCRDYIYENISAQEHW